MFSRFARCLLLAGFLLNVASCTCYAVREQTDRDVCDLASQRIDLEPAQPAEQLPIPKSASIAPDAPAIQPVEAREPEQAAAPQPPPAASKDQKKEGYQPRPLELRPELPGANAPAFRYPTDVKSRSVLGASTVGLMASPFGQGSFPVASLLLPETIRDVYHRKFFPPLPPLGKEPQPLPGPNGNPLALADLQRLARANNPDIVRAVANVRAMEGAAIQAGHHPNPNFGYAADTISNGATAGFQGVFFEQMIKTAGKLELARQIASVDVVNARVALRATENDVATRVRSAYFAVLVAQENVRVNRALTQFTEDTYNAGLDLLRYGIAVPYEPMQFRSQVFQARNSLVQARNNYQTAWRQLASALGLPGLPPTQLAGRVDAALPIFDFEQVRDRVLSRHTDVLTALNDILRARLSLRLARITPIPDADLQLKFQKDYTAPPHLLATSIQLTIPVPVWDRNQGSIVQAEALLRSAEEEPHKARDDLLARLADAFGRYQTDRVQIEYFRDHILPDQLRGYKGLYDRYQVDAASGRMNPFTSAVPTFQDLVNAQQSLVMIIQTYLTALGNTWTSVVDVANLLQTDDLFQVSERQDLHPIPELGPLPCCHTCSPLRDPRLYGGNGPWSPAAPEEQLQANQPSPGKPEGGPAQTPRGTTPN